MSLVAEDGTGLSNANSYISLAAANTYWVDYGSPTEWDAASTTEKSAALMYATRWLDDNFAWYSTIYSVTQNLGWPRWSYYDNENREVPSGTVPQRVKDATCEIALVHLKDGLNSSDNEGIKSEKIGDASVTYSSSNNQKSYSFVKVSLRQYGTSGKGSVNSLYRN